MSKASLKMAAIGECMLELSHVGDDLYKQRFAGDAFNTSVYLARILGANADVYFVSSVGEDRLSEEMIEYCQSESICCDYICKVPKKIPGLYRINTDVDGERTFQYWRSDSAAKMLFYCSSFASVRKALLDFDILFISGISVAILDDYSREQLVDLIKELKIAGVRIYFDPNYRAALWSDLNQAQWVLNQFAMLSDVVLPSFDDEKSLYPNISITDVLAKYGAMGIEEIVLKNGEHSCFVRVEGITHEVILLQRVQPLDTTGAGDSFNAGYIAARANQKNVSDSVNMGNELAAVVVKNLGAIIDKNDMPTFFNLEYLN